MEKRMDAIRRLRLLGNLENCLAEMERIRPLTAEEREDLTGTRSEIAILQTQLSYRGGHAYLAESGREYSDAPDHRETMETRLTAPTDPGARMNAAGVKIVETKAAREEDQQWDRRKVSGGWLSLAALAARDAEDPHWREKQFGMTH
jgi:hypothetical protein